VHVIEEEARTLLMKALKGAKATIAAHRASLDSLVKALLSTETLEKAELQRLLGPSANRRAHLAVLA
jgi:ATP-dependent Zn protease